MYSKNYRKLVKLQKETLKENKVGSDEGRQNEIKAENTKENNKVKCGKDYRKPIKRLEVTAKESKAGSGKDKEKPIK